MKAKLDDLICYRLFRTVKINEQLIDKNMEQYQLSRTQWKIIARFNFLPCPCTQQAMLSSMGIDRAHLTRALDQLEARDFIKKQRMPSDKRAFNLSLTHTGKALLNKIEKSLSDETALITKGLSNAEIKQLIKWLDTIESNATQALEHIKTQNNGEKT